MCLRVGLARRSYRVRGAGRSEGRVLMFKWARTSLLGMVENGGVCIFQLVGPPNGAHSTPSGSWGQQRWVNPRQRPGANDI